MKMDVVISGVGGQGNIFASLVISQYAMNKKLNVLGAETIGAAQRGGAVVSHIRIAEGEIYSPLISRGQADLLISMEYVEMLRHIRLLNPQGAYLLNAMKIPTVLNNMGLDEYPEQEEILKAARQYCPNGYVIEASATAKKLGNIQMTNVVMLGALVRIMPFFDYDEFKWLINANSPERFKEANIKGFEEGFKLIN
ncbi:MAG: indolepyruvate ferredoxin oxidoreductase subunit beta [Deltaproteobacteria bacterium]|nr:indolepyruvate ferredoxin oxidoreductase subunit beta [Deltaproteobacteria bacterium]